MANKKFIVSLASLDSNYVRAKSTEFCSENSRQLAIPFATFQQSCVDPITDFLTKEIAAGRTVRLSNLLEKQEKQRTVTENERMLQSLRATDGRVGPLMSTAEVIPVKTAASVPAASTANTAAVKPLPTFAEGKNLVLEAPSTAHVSESMNILYACNH